MSHGDAPGEINVAAFGVHSDDQSDSTPGVAAALEQCRATGAQKLIFPPGRYDFWPDRATERFFWISNNDPGMKRIAFDLQGMHDLTIDGQKARFVFHGFMLPFLLDNAKNITLENFSIDWARTFHSEATILKVAPDGVDLSFSDKFPYKIENDILTFTGEGKTVYPVNGLLEFSPTKLETAFESGDFWKGPIYRAKELAPGRIHLLVSGLKVTPGNVLVFCAADRLCPGITVSDSSTVHVQSVNVYHAGGMAFVAQRSTDLTLDHFQVVPAPESGRVISATADATHFANCKGQITMTNCRFTNQCDDATNIHGIYAEITKQISPTELEVKLEHPQQYGFDFIKTGERLEFTHGPSMVSYSHGLVKDVHRINEEYTRVVLSEPTGSDLQLGDVVSDDTGYPDVTISHCYIGNNRARGLLLGSRGKIVIENNTFHTPGAAILLEGDARFWFEQAGVRSLLISDNIFDNCNYGTWGNSVIQVGAGIAKDYQPISRYNRNIVIEDNVFQVFDPRIIRGYSLDGLIFRHNIIKNSTDYPPQNQGAAPFVITSSDNIHVQP